ncbi:MAG: hypothetical protein GQ570_03415 [Helicobacteraceae bacterium]|nr:hypothetical protein [Helicobacteraceae bacterium]
MKMLHRMNRYYSKNIVLFLLMHPTFYFGIYIYFILGEPIILLILVLIKIVDMSVKIQLLHQVFKIRKLSQEMTLMLLTPINPNIIYFNLLIYVPLVVMVTI